MLERLQTELDKFRAWPKNEKLLSHYRLELVTQDFYRLCPVGIEDKDDKIDLCFMALTHGNEVAGLAVINELAFALSYGLLKGPLRLGLAVANSQAALKDKRFIERDLNRSFNLTKAPELLEEKRARELEKGLVKCRYLIDFHQTIEASSEAFAIFPYERACFELARSVASDLAIVTHWGKSFSKDGACSDEYVNKNGGVGITIELGQKGFSSYQEALGFRVAAKAIACVETKLDTGKWIASEHPARIYTWAEVIDFPEGKAGLDQGWYNFKEVRKGERLGYYPGGEICAGVSGPILFPKYVKRESDPKPKEICRILRQVEEDQLGT